MAFGQPPTIGELVYQLRVERGWTQEQLARFSGLTPNAISNLERRVTSLPNIETVERLARAFRVDPEELDPRILAERVEQEALSPARRRAITLLLNMSERDIEATLALAQQTKRLKRRRTRRS